jgi:hypothetical protein
MIVEKILDRYTQRAQARRRARGNPTGSAFGTCAAQLQFLRYPDAATPEPISPRGLLVLEGGDEIEAWWTNQIAEDYPTETGLAQEPFYYRVPVTEVQAIQLRDRISARTIWGTVRPAFEPPRVQLVDDRVRVRLLPCPECDATGKRDHGFPCGKKLGFVLDPLTRVLWAPTYLDRVIRHPTAGLAVLEKKAMSDFAFRRALLADPGYRLRCQLAGQAKATGMAVVLLAFRKETGHLLELCYTPSPDADGRVRIDLIRSTGARERYLVTSANTAPLLQREDGAPGQLPTDVEWDGAEVWSPFDSAIHAQIQARILRVLLSRAGDWAREYGPDFRCGKCRGNPGKTPKGRKACGACAGQVTLTKAPLPRFPCGYCSVRHACYPIAQLGYERGENGAKPVWMVEKRAFDDAGMWFTPPEPSGVDVLEALRASARPEDAVAVAAEDNGEQGSLL